jgi:hypothetical protein
VHTTGTPAHDPVAVHRSVVVHALPSLHVTVVGFATTAGVEHVPTFGSQTPATWQTSGAVHVTVSHGCTVRQTFSSWIDQTFVAVPVCTILKKRAVFVRKLIVTS